MAVEIRYNPNVLSLFQTFYTNKETDLLESLTWLINEEKSFGNTKEQGNMIVHLAHFYFEVIELLRQSIVSTWTYLDWLTQDEYNIIMRKREILEY